MLNINVRCNTKYTGATKLKCNTNILLIITLQERQIDSGRQLDIYTGNKVTNIFIIAVTPR